MTGVQTCALPICFPVTIPNGIAWNKGEGKDVRPGQRTDLEAIVNGIKSGMKRKAIAMEHGAAFIKYHKGIEALANALDLDLDADVPNFVQRECHIFYGDAGTGKSLAAMRIIGDDSYYKPQKNNAGLYSFETYKGQKWLLLDEYDPDKSLPGLSSLKEMMDQYQCTLPSRGTASGVKSRHLGVIVTTNFDPMFWTKGTTAQQQIDWKAIKRRCKSIWDCQEDAWTYVAGTLEVYQPGQKIKPQLPSLLEWLKERQAPQEPQEQIGSQESPIEL